MSKQISVTFFSNFLLHHQTPFCQAMVKRLKDNFKFVATVDIPQDRLDMGYKDFRQESYAINAYESKEKYSQAMELANNSDVVILGDAPIEFIKDRLSKGKLTFKYSERFFKNGYWRILDPRVFKQRYIQDIKFRHSNLHMLCASAYTAKDCKFIGCYKNKTYKWGYFPEVKKYDDVESLVDNKKENSILWVGRLLKLKHPELAVRVAEKLKKKNIPFSLEIIGEGEMENKIKKLITKKNLADKVTLKGFIPIEEVREKMEKADIFLFTSDRNEGWGAVLNESMNSACGVVASKEIGSVPYLIKDGQNGLVFNRRKKNDIVKKVELLLKDKKLKRNVQLNAYNTLISTWNAEDAADRLLALIDLINSNKAINVLDGPASKDVY